MSASKLMLGLALAGLALSGCNKEDNSKPVSTPNAPTTAHSRQVTGATEPSATGGTDTNTPTTAPIALPPVIPGAGGPTTSPATRPTGSSSGTGSGTSGTGSGTGGGAGGGSDLNK